MKLEDFDYTLPERLIAQAPVRPRDASRLLVVPRGGASFVERRFADIIEYFKAGDVLVLNDSKVIPARLLGKKVSGGAVEIFLSRRIGTKKSERWEALVKGKRMQVGAEIIFARGFSARLIEKIFEGWLVDFTFEGPFEKLLAKYGKVPLPPYIVSAGTVRDRERYQTVYAVNSHAGSVAAPTAGLHFTPRLLHALEKKGVIIKYITLHVGLGTFLPVRVDDPKKHVMHAEWVEVGAGVKVAIKAARKRGNKVIAVGTTTLRSLEAAYKISERGSFKGWVDIFIYPPYRFKAVDGLITNFHLPKSTLLMLVSALAGTDTIRQAYAHAVKKKFRFYSYGDAMLIL